MNTQVTKVSQSMSFVFSPRSLNQSMTTIMKQSGIYNQIFVPPTYFKQFCINRRSFESNRHAQDKFNLIYILQPIFETPRTHAVIQTKAPSLALTFTETKSKLMESTNSLQNY